MKRNFLGDIVAEEWVKATLQRKNIILDEWVVMPDHFHGILVIEPAMEEMPASDKALVASDKALVASDKALVATSHRDVASKVFPHKLTSPNPIASPTLLKPNSVGSIICQFKSLCTKRIWALGYNQFRWQSRYHDRIIRTEKSLFRIRNYIRENPENY